MATGHWWTNRGKKSVLTTALHGATNLYMGLLQGAGGAPTTIDSAAEVADLNTVTDLLALATEAAGGSYARQNLTGVTVTEDDTNDRANIDSANPVFPAVAAGAEIYGYWIQRGTGVNGDDLITVGILKDNATGTGITPNGSDITATVNDFARAT